MEYTDIVNQISDLLDLNHKFEYSLFVMLILYDAYRMTKQLL